MAPLPFAGMPYLCPHISFHENKEIAVTGSNLRTLAFNGIFWTAVETYGRQIMQFAVSIVLARLLLPEDFGLIAVVMVFISIANTMVDSGMSSALIQKRNTTAEDENTIFYTNIVIAAVVYAILWFGASHVATFYAMPSLKVLLRTLSVGIVISSFSLIHTTLIRKRLDFRNLFYRSAIAIPISGVLGIVAAYKGFGVWSLVIQHLSNSLISMICYWKATRWRPKWIFSTDSFRALFGYGSRQLGAGLLDTAFNYIYEMVIAKLFSAATLGYYSRASHLQRFVTNNFTSIPYRVAFPLLATVSHDENIVRKGTARLLKTMCLFVFPVMAGLMIVAEPLVDVLLTAKWLPCVPYLQLLCVVGLLFPIHVANVNVLRVRGEMQLFLKLEILKKALTVLAIAITWRHGIIAMLWGQIVQNVAALLLNIHYGGGEIRYGFLKQLKDAAPYAALTLVMAGAARAAGNVWTDSSLFSLIFQSVTGAAVYAACCRVLKLPEYAMVWDWLRNNIGAKKS